MSDNNLNHQLNSENSSESYLDINADTETMNKQLSKHMSKTNARLNTGSNSNPNDDTPHKVIHIDKEILKTLIIEWLSLDDQIKSFRETIKDKTEEKKQYEDQLLDLMGALNQEIILTDKGNITRNVKESKGALTPELIKTTLTDILKCAETADTYTNHIMDKRLIKESVNLKRQTLDDNKKTKNPKSKSNPKKGPQKYNKNRPNQDHIDDV
jgi:hypothetical protein